jgi:hypothetical protein
MGYACPVCEDPQSDAEHLANHLAFTAMLGDDDHAEWLDERVADWAEMGPPELAEAITDDADETEFPQVFEDTTDARAGDEPINDHGHQEHGHDHGNAGGHSHGSDPDVDPAVEAAGYESMDVSDEERAEAEDVLAEAREMTRKRRANVGDGTSEGNGEGSEGSGDGESGDADEA